MKKLSLFFLLLALALTAFYVLRQTSLNFYEITCGEPGDERQYVATKSLGNNKYLVRGDEQDFTGCKVRLVEID